MIFITLVEILGYRKFLNLPLNPPADITSLKQDLESSHTTCELLRKQFARSQEEVDESERQRKEEVRALEGKREDDLKMYAAQHQV